MGVSTQLLVFAWIVFWRTDLTIGRIEGFPSQAASNNDKAAAKSLYKLIERLFRDFPKLKAFARELTGEGLTDAVLLSSFTFLLQPDSILTADPDSLDEHGIPQRYFPNDSDAIYPEQARSFENVFCHFLISSERDRFLEEVAAIKGVRTADKIDEKCTQLEVAFMRLVKRARAGQNAWDALVSLEFLQAEYSKRQFFLDQLENECLRDMARGVFNFLNMHFEKLVGKKPDHCVDCVWGKDAARLGERAVFSWGGCDGRECDFTRHLMRLAQLDVEGATVTEGKKVLPVEDVYESRKKTLCGYKYHEMDEDRLVGLWLWDQAWMLGDFKNIPSTWFENMLREPWFQCTPLGKRVYLSCEQANKDYDDFEKAERYMNAYDSAIVALKDCFESTKECVRQGRILPKYASLKQSDVAS